MKMPKGITIVAILMIINGVYTHRWSRFYHLFCANIDRTDYRDLIIFTHLYPAHGNTSYGMLLKNV